MSSGIASTDITDSTDYTSEPIIDEILQVRTGQVRPCFGVSELSAIFKTPRYEPVKVSKLGCEGDERAYINHQGPDQALMQYSAKHYKLWQAENPQKSQDFVPGGFGENIVAEEADEHSMCIGDILRLGDGVLVQVSEPRQPCYKLNLRFEIKDMSLQTQIKGRTGWYYRVLRGGYLQRGDQIVLVGRKHPKWTVAKVLQHLYEEPYKKDQEMMAELAQLQELGIGVRKVFETRLMKIKSATQRMQRGSEEASRWSQYRLVERRKETPRISSFVFEAINSRTDPKKCEPGSHIRVKLGEDGKLVRAYSMVDGDSNCFKLGITLDPYMTRGGARHLHEKIHIGDVLIFGEMKSDFPLSPEADEHIFIAGGIGITALIASAKMLQSQDQTYHLYYAVRSESEIAFKTELQLLGDNVTIFDGGKAQRLDLPKVIGKAGKESHIYVCGPERLLDAVTSTADTLRFPRPNVHFEAFTVATPGDPFSVELAKAKQILEVKSDQTLLDVLRDAGFDTPSSCEVGNCGTCWIGVKKGKVEHRGKGLMEKEKENSMLSCVSRGIGRILVDL